MAAEVVILPDGVAAVNAAVDHALEELANAMEAEAKRVAPVGTSAEHDPHPGAFRDSIHTVHDGPGRWSLIADSEDAPFNEFGTVYRRPEPAIGPATQFGTAHLPEIVGAALAERLG